jgi:hypothetical protein
LDVAARKAGFENFRHAHKQLAEPMVAADTLPHPKRKRAAIRPNNLPHSRLHADSFLHEWRPRRQFAAGTALG